MRKRILTPIFLSLGILFVLVSMAPAQTFYGSISGIVKDDTGGIVPGATVTLINLGTNVRRTLLTDDNGFYQFPSLLPANYRIEAELSGFKRFAREPINVEVDSAVRIDITLDVGEITETVQVTAATPLLESQSSSLGEVVQERKVQEMPLNGRNPLGLTGLVPGVVPQGSRENSSTGTPTGVNIFAWGNIQIGGGMANQSAAYIDGAPINTAYLNLLSLVPTQDAIQEFKVQTNNMGPEFSRFAGGVINFTTKTGSNDFHGTVYEFLRNRVLNANDFFNNAKGIERSPFTQNQFGGNIGGRLIRDKTFWFFSYEGFRQRRGLPFLTTVPTPEMRDGDFSNLRDGSGNLIPIFDPQTVCGRLGNPPCPVDSQGNEIITREQFPNNIIPADRIDPTSRILTDLWPRPNVAGEPFTNVNNWAGDASVGGDNDQYTGRMDHSFSENHNLFGRYTYWTNLSLGIEPFNNAICVDRCDEEFNTHQFALGDSYSFSPSTLLDVRVSFLRFHYDRLPKSLGVDLTTIGWPASLNDQVAWRHIPPPNVSGYAGEIMGSGDGAGSGIFARNDVYHIAPTLTKIMGRHTFSIGGEIRRNTHNYAQSNNPSGGFDFNRNFTAVSPFNPGGTGDAFASYLLGASSGANAGTPSFVASQQIHRSVFFGDKFQVTPDLTLDLGLRYDQFGPWTERFDRLTFLMLNAESPLAGPTGLPLVGRLGLVDSEDRPERNNVDLDKKMFSPRLGMAYRLAERTVLRAGYGIFWLPNDLNWNITPHNDAVSSVSTSMVTTIDGGITPFNRLSDPFPQGLIQPPGRDPVFQSRLLGQGIGAPLTDNPSGYVQQWNLNIQQEVMEGLLVDMAYAGSKGTKLVRHSLQINQLPEEFMSLGPALQDQVPNPFFGLIETGPLSNETVSRGQLLRPYPQYDSVNIDGPNIGNSIYHSAQVKVEKRLGGGGNVLASYTFSKLISDTDTLTGWLESGRGGTPWGAENSYNLQAERAVASFDVPQRLVVSYVLDLPFGEGRRLLTDAPGVVGELVSGWAVSGAATFQSGFPLQPGTSQNLTNSFGGGGRPNWNGQSGEVPGSAQERLNRWFDTSIFTQPPAFTFGNSARTFTGVRSHGVNNFDFALFKNTRFGPNEDLNFQFRAEFFNLFNRTQFDYPGQVLGNAQFGVVSAQANRPRLIQFGLRLSF